MNTVKVFGTLRLTTAFKHFPETVFSLDRYNSFKWAILGTLCASRLARIFTGLKNFTVS